MKYFYARVSSATQNLDRQVKLFKEMGAHDRDIFIEKNQVKVLKIEKNGSHFTIDLDLGDIVVIKNLDRLGRNAKEVREVLLSLANNNITIKSIDQAYLNNFLKDKLANREADSLAEAMLNAMLDTMLEVDLLKAEWERKELRKRQEEGIRRAREKGLVFGRKKNDNYREGVKEFYPRTRNKDADNYITVKEATEIIGCSKKTFYLLVEEIFGKVQK